MTEERIAIIVEKLKKIVSTNFSDYAGFRLKVSPEGKFHNCFIINNEPLYSSNFTTRVDEFEDAIKIIKALTGKSKEKIIQELRDTGSYYRENEQLFLHYLKLTQKCED